MNYWTIDETAKKWGITPRQVRNYCAHGRIYGATVEIPLSEIPAGKKLTIAVRPVSSLGTKGKTIGTTFRV